MAVANLRPWPLIEVAGNALPDAVEELLEQVVVDTHLHLPDMFMLCFRDMDHQVLRHAGLQMGVQVKISGVRPGGQTPEAIVTGEVTAIEAEYDARGAYAVVRGYDASHRLHRGRRTETYKNVKDSDIARTVASRAGLQIGTIDTSSGTHDHVSQANLSDWEFLKARAREIGFEIAVVDGMFNFRKPVDSSTAPSQGDYNSTNALQLVLGQDLLEFRPRITSAQQVKEVTVRGWDAAKKQALIGRAQAGTTSAVLSATPAGLAKKFGDPSFVVVDRPLSTQGQVDEAAKSIAEQIGSAVAEAEGVARGIPKLKAGTAISIAEVMDDFAGSYTLTHTRHVFDAEGYRTHFVVSGRQDRSLLGLASLGSSNGSASAGGPPIYGMVVALVTNNDDPDKLGRVKLKFPWLSDSYESDWARMVQLGAGPNSGAVFLPEVNDEVLVAFEFGDVRRPYVVGNLYNGRDKPKLGSGLFDHGKVKRRGFISRRGHQAIFLDDAGKSGIALITSNGKLKVTLNESRSEIQIFCQGKIMLKAQGDLTLDSQSNLKLTAQQGITLEAQTQLGLKGNTGAKLESSAMVEVSNGAAGIKLSGPQVSVNNGALEVT